MTPQKQKEIAEETLSIYAPIANRLGICKIKADLEDLSLRYIEPEVYYDLAHQIASKRKERVQYIEHIVEQIKAKVEEAGIELQDKDVIAITEAVVGISQGNYATADQIAKDVTSKFGDETVGLIFPIMSRNRFSMLLKGISRGCKKLVIQLSYPGDEVGNHLISEDALFDSGVNPYSDV